MAAYRALTAAAPRELATWLILLNAPPAPFVPAAWHGRRLCAFAVCHSGDPGDAERDLAPVRALGDPVFDLLGPQPYTEVQSYLDDTEPDGHHYYWRTEFLAGLEDGLLAGMRELFADCPVPEAELGLLHLGGALIEQSRILPNQGQSSLANTAETDRQPVGSPGMSPPMIVVVPPHPQHRILKQSVGQPLPLVLVKDWIEPIIDSRNLA